MILWRMEFMSCPPRLLLSSSPGGRPCSSSMSAADLFEKCYHDVIEEPLDNGAGPAEAREMPDCGEDSDVGYICVPLQHLHQGRDPARYDRPRCYEPCSKLLSWVICAGFHCPLYQSGELLRVLSSLLLGIKESVGAEFDEENGKGC